VAAVSIHKWLQVVICGYLSLHAVRPKYTVRNSKIRRVKPMKNALYYPHIAFRDPSWIKAMALYYDNVYRIVPTDLTPDDPEELKALLEEGCIGKRIDPAKYSKNASEEFLNKSSEWRAAALTYGDEDEELITRLHTEKTDERVRELFREAGFKADNDWMYVPTAIASNFMLYMANEIASKNDLSLITADWGAWTGSSYFSIDGQVNDFITTIGKDDIAAEDADDFGLFGLLINELIPLNISDIPAEKIVEFRRKRKDEINQFRNCIKELRSELTAVESSEIRIDIIENKAKALAEAQKQYRASADIIKAKNWFGVSLMGFPAPLIFGQLFSIPSTSTVALAATGLALGGLFNIHNTKEEIRKLKEKSPASFLVELRNSFKAYTRARGGGDMNFHAYNCMEEYVND
jgi:Family of unknown function (DUF6236)